MKVKVTMQKYHNQALNNKVKLFSFHLWMYNSSFLLMDSTNSNVNFHFDVSLHPRLFCFVINATDTCKYATNETRTSSPMDDHVKHSVLRSRVRQARQNKNSAD